MGVNKQPLIFMPSRIYASCCICYSLLLTLILSYTGIVLTSLVLFVLGLFQLLQTGILLAHFHATTNSSLHSVRWLGYLIGGLFLLLISGYVFAELYARWRQPSMMAIEGGDYASAALLAFGASNLYIYATIGRFDRFEWPTFLIKIPIVIGIAISLTVALAYFTMQAHDVYFLDSVVSFGLNCTVSVAGIFIFLDAYWKVLEVA